MSSKSLTRRIIAVAFCLTGAGTLTYLSISGDREALIALIAAMNIVVGFYFGVKATQI